MSWIPKFAWNSKILPLFLPDTYRALLCSSYIQLWQTDFFFEILWRGFFSASYARSFNKFSFLPFICLFPLYVYKKYYKNIWVSKVGNYIFVYDYYILYFLFYIFNEFYLGFTVLHSGKSFWQFYLYNVPLNRGWSIKNRTGSKSTIFELSSWNLVRITVHWGGLFVQVS